MTKIISINDTSVSNGTTYYHVSVRLPLRLHTVLKRYSEFQDLVDKLSEELGIRHSDFPYKLPPKKLLFKNSSGTVDGRRLQLEDFLNCVVLDSSLRNTTEVLTFLRTPETFKFNEKMFKDNLFDLEIAESIIDQGSWLELMRLLRAKLESVTTDYSSNPNIKSALNVKDLISRTLNPTIDKLDKSLQRTKLSLASDEYAKRLSLLNNILKDIQSLNAIVLSRDTKGSANRSRRVLGGGPKETNETIALNNRELHQYQIQEQRSQDSELLELRKLIARQKELGILINEEIEQQNETLDAFAQEVDSTSDRLKQARKRAKEVV